MTVVICTIFSAGGHTAKFFSLEVNTHKKGLIRLKIEGKKEKTPALAI